MTGFVVQGHMIIFQVLHAKKVNWDSKSSSMVLSVISTLDPWSVKPDSGSSYLMQGCQFQFLSWKWATFKLLPWVDFPLG